jgi:WS/DGAT/MGAT family acyltransferase
MSCHLDRLSGFDASFLLQEGPTTHAHVGGTAVVAGPAPTLEEMRRQVASRLDLMPRYRHRLAHTAVDRARPVWVDDTEFELAYHVRHLSAAPPGGREQYHAAVATAYSTPLDRSRPLWEIWLVDGLADGDFGLVFKVHHAMVDGSAAVDLLKILCDFTPQPAPAAGSLSRWQPQPTPGTLGLVALGAREVAGTGARVAAGALGALRRPLGSLRGTVDVLSGAGALARQLLRTPPATPLTTEVGPERLFVGIRCRLDDAKLVKNSLGGTVNDVVLAVVSGALREFLITRGVETAGLTLSALVPVSVRAEKDQGRLGNRIAVMRGCLPVGIADPVRRLAAVVAGMSALKDSRQSRATEFMLGAQDFLPPILLPLVTRVNVSPRLFNVMVTNIPGPQMPLYVLGRELTELYPTALLQPKHPLAIAVTSYNGQLNFGLLADSETLPDVDVVAEAIESGLAELVALARPAHVNSLTHIM